MFKEIIEYDNALDAIKDLDLNESQSDTLIKIIIENPRLSAPKLIEIADLLADGEHIILDAGTYSIDPILNESNYTVSLLEVALPVIFKHIPKEIICYMTEAHTRVIADKILDIELNEKTTRQDLTNRIDEMFSAGNLSIPMQGLRSSPEPLVVVLRGGFSGKLHKGIQFKNDYVNSGTSNTKSSCQNNFTMRSALKEFTMIGMETPLSEILPKFIMVLKNLVEE